MNCVLLHSEKGSNLKYDNLLPLGGVNSYLLEKTPFQKGFRVLESKQEVTKVIYLVETGRKEPSIYPLNVKINCV